MPVLVHRASQTCLSAAAENSSSSSSLRLKLNTQFPQGKTEEHCPILPGLPDDVAKYCIALVPRSFLPSLGTVSRQWRSFIQSKEFYSLRKQSGKLEEWIYFLRDDRNGMASRTGCKQVLPQMPGPLKAEFGVVVCYGKLLVMAGYLVESSKNCVSKDVYEYDSRLNRWSALAGMNVARRDFACAEVNGLVYVVGGYGCDSEILSSVEVYDPEDNKWSLIESIRRPRWGCFGCGIEGKVYVMGGRSSFMIGNSKLVDVYNPECKSWSASKNGCVMVTAHAVVGNRLFCMEWKDQRRFAIFDTKSNTWKTVPLPVTGSSSTGFYFGTLNGKLLLFSLKCETLVYDPEAPVGEEWETSSLTSPGMCSFCVTIQA